MISGIFAAIVTTPFDVIKTRQQTNINEGNTFTLIKQIYLLEGYYYYYY